MNSPSVEEAVARSLSRMAILGIPVDPDVPLAAQDVDSLMWVELLMCAGDGGIDLELEPAEVGQMTARQLFARVAASTGSASA